MLTVESARRTHTVAHANGRTIMHAVTRTLIAAVVVCGLVVGQTGPRLLASSPDANHGAARDALQALYRATGGDNWDDSDNRPGAATDGEFATVRAGAHTPDREFDLADANEEPTSIWSDGATMWVADPDDDKLYAYDLATGARTPDREFDLADANESPTGIWSDGATLWVADSWDEKLYAYDLATGARTPDREFDLANGNDVPRGIWSDGATLWVADYRNDKLYAYDLATGATGSAETDRAALEALYHATDGDNWTNNDNWLTDAPLIEWHGVTTDSSDRVTELLLSDNRLHGEIPTELGRLDYLTILDLSDNRLHGEIPAELGRLDYLIALGLSNNQLHGEIPAELGSLDNLIALALHQNRLHGEIPTELGSLDNLLALGLSNNQLSGCLPAAWHNNDLLRTGENDLEDLQLPFCTQTTQPLGTPSLSVQWTPNMDASAAIVTLTWTPVTGATSYTLLRRIGADGDFAPIGDNLSLTDTYTDYDVPFGLTYQYVVLAANTSGPGPRSNEAQVALPSAWTLPGKPTLKIAFVTLLPGMAIEIWWQEESGLADAYEVEWRFNGGEWETAPGARMTNSLGAQTRHVNFLAQLAPGHYTYRVRGNRWGHGPGPWSNAAQATVPAADPNSAPPSEKPTLHVLSTNPHQVRLAWTEVAGATSYDLWRCSDTKDQKITHSIVLKTAPAITVHLLTHGTHLVLAELIKEVAQELAQELLIETFTHFFSEDTPHERCINVWTPMGVILNETTYTDDDVTPKTYHYYMARGWNAAGPGPWSHLIQLDPGTPNLSLLELTETSITLAWTGVDGVTDYEIRDCGAWQRLWSTCDETGWNYTPDSSRPHYTFTIDGLTPRREYSFEARARQGDTFSSWSNAILVKPGMPTEPPATQAEISFNEAGAPAVHLSWEAVNYATEYEVRRSGDARRFDVLFNITTTRREFTDVNVPLRSGRLERTHNYYYVRARNDFSEGPWTSIACSMQEAGTCTVIPPDEVTTPGYR